MHTPLTAGLQTFLADIHMTYHRAHEYHWNLSGIQFPAYHKLFQKIYESAYSYADPTGENILKLGEKVIYEPMALCHLTTITEPETMETDAMSMAISLLYAVDRTIFTANQVLRAATQADEQGVINFLAGFIDDFKTWSWQLKASTSE